MPETPQREPLILKEGDLEAAVIDNSESGSHRFGYNGLASLTHKECSESPFVPNYAGVNFEFLFDGTRHNMEPRWRKEENETLIATPSEVKISGPNRASVHLPETVDWGIESWVAYQLVAPHYVDISIRIQPRKDTFQHGYIGAFFASYIHGPEQKEVRLWGKRKPDPESRWVEGDLPEGDVWNSYRFLNELPGLTRDPFFFGGTSDLMFEKPVMYGRFRNMALVFMFDRGEGIRLAYRRDGAGEKNPAWDFGILIPDHKIRRIYSRQVRLVYKPFISEDDLMEEYEQWKGPRGR